MKRASSTSWMISTCRSLRGSTEPRSGPKQFGFWIEVFGVVNEEDELVEATLLLAELRSWSEEEIEELPKLYREKAREFRELANPGND